MRTEKIYIADDGTRFEGVNAYARCIEYEHNKALDECVELRDYIRFYSWRGVELNAKSVSKNIYSVYFVKVLAIPDEEENEKVYKAWDNTISCELDYIIKACGDGLGWYYSNGDDDWRYWDDTVKEYEERKAKIETIEKGQ